MASKIVNTRLVHFPYDVKLRLLAHSRSYLANQKARNAIVSAENLLNYNIPGIIFPGELALRQIMKSFARDDSFISSYRMFPTTKGDMLSKKEVLL